MKITKSQLKQIIQEELSAILGEEELNEFGANPLNPDFNSPHYGSDKHKSDLLKQSKCKEAKEKLRALEASYAGYHPGQSLSSVFMDTDVMGAIFDLKSEYPDCFPRRKPEEEKKRAAQE